jgi:ribonuclease HI
MEIGQYDVEFIPSGRSSLRHSQISLQNGLIQVCEASMSYLIIGSCILTDPTPWGAGAGIVLIPPKGDILKYVIQLEFAATNNIAEYKGLVTGLQLAKELDIHRLLIQGDSQLVAKQVQKEYDRNSDKMAKYLTEVRRLEMFFDDFKVRYVSHLDNWDANHLAWIASSRALTLLNVIIEKLTKPSVKAIELVEEANLMVIDGPEQWLAYDWMSPIISYLDNHPLSDDNAEIERVTCKARMYHLMDGVLYRQGVNGMMMRCISNEEGIQLLQDIHSGVCEAHSSWRSIIRKAFMHEFY